MFLAASQVPGVAELFLSVLTSLGFSIFLFLTDSTSTIIYEVLVRLFFRSRVLLLSGAKRGNEQIVKGARRELRLGLHQCLRSVIFLL